MDLIEAYYAVAQHLEEQAARKAEVADMLGKMADAMSEARMRDNNARPQGGARSDQAATAVGAESTAAGSTVTRG